jgi:hypothetical protein
VHDRAFTVKNAGISKPVPTVWMLTGNLFRDIGRDTHG